jgi:hypothetical protein
MTWALGKALQMNPSKRHDRPWTGARQCVQRSRDFGAELMTNAYAVLERETLEL